MRIESIIFKRTEKSPWEEGIMINEDQLILDYTGKVVPDEPQIWNYQRTTRLAIEFDAVAKIQKGVQVK